MEVGLIIVGIVNWACCRIQPIIYGWINGRWTGDQRLAKAYHDNRHCMQILHSMLQPVFKSLLAVISWSSSGPDPRPSRWFVIQLIDGTPMARAWPSQSPGRYKSVTFKAPIHETIAVTLPRTVCKWYTFIFRLQKRLSKYQKHSHQFDHLFNLSFLLK